MHMKTSKKLVQIPTADVHIQWTSEHASTMENWTCKHNELYSKVMLLVCVSSSWFNVYMNVLAANQSIKFHNMHAHFLTNVYIVPRTKEEATCITTYAAIYNRWKKAANSNMLFFC